jgi:toxin FitB
MTNVVDSSGWLEYFADGPNADFFAPAIENTRVLIVPSISIFEVFKRVLIQRGEDAALHSVAQMHQGRVVNLEADIAIASARLSCDLELPLAGCIVLTTARRHDAEVWTQDSDFMGIEGVHYKEKVTRAR